MKFLGVVFIVLCSLPVKSEELILLYDGGNSTLINKGKDPKMMLERADPVTVMASAFPIKTSAWSLGTFSSKEISLPEMKSPIFFVGCDDVSSRWVVQRSALIEERRALGFVVDCPSIEQFKLFKANIYPIIVQAANMDKIVSHIGHGIYPAYVHSRAIEQ